MTKIQMTKTIKTKTYPERPVVRKVEPSRGNGQSGAKADLFEGYFPKCGFIAEALDTVETAENLQIQVIELNKLIKEQGALIKAQKNAISELKQRLTELEQKVK